MRELANYSRLSHQWLSKLELGLSKCSDKHKKQILNGFEELIADRRSKLYLLEREFLINKDQLFRMEGVEDE